MNATLILGCLYDSFSVLLGMATTFSASSLASTVLRHKILSSKCLPMPQCPKNVLKSTGNCAPTRKPSLNGDSYSKSFAYSKSLLHCPFYIKMHL